MDLIYIYGNLAHNIALREYMFERDGPICVYCGDEYETITKLTIDHVIPKTMGGSNEIFNLVLSCYDCNRNKGGKNNSLLINYLLQVRRLRELRGILEETIPSRVLEKLPTQIKEHYSGK